MSLQCPICSKEFKEDEDSIPKVLKCGDTLCMQCIKKMYESENVNCPSCHLEIDQKIEDLPTNKYIIDVKKTIICDICLKEYSSTNSGERVPKILKCGDTFCSKCLKDLMDNGQGKIKCKFCGFESTEDISLLPDNQCIINLAAHELYINVKYLTEKKIAPKDLCYQFSLGLMGEADGGKTSITHFFHTGKTIESSTSIPTLGFEYHYKYISINGQFVKVTLWDTAGQERFGSMSAGALRGAHGLLLVFSLTIGTNHDDYKRWQSSKGEEKKEIEKDFTENAFATVDFWLEQFYQFNQLEQKVIYLIGNKADDRKNRIIKKKDAKKYAENRKLTYFETSAKTGQNIYNAFENLIIELIEIYPNRISRRGTELNNVNIHGDEDNNDCCSNNKKKK